MDPLNDMCQALVSIKNILQKRKEIIGDSAMQSTVIENVNSERELQVSIASPSNHSQLEALTEDNFHRAHLCNRSIDELPNINVLDIKQLKSIHIYTMQDLLGRFLIHDTPEDFYTFLLNTFQLSQTTALTITQLFHRWTKHNLDATIDKKKSAMMKIID